MTWTMKRIRHLSAAVALLALGGVMGCNELTGHQPLPAGTNNPSFYSTPAGAIGMRNAAINAVEQGLPSFLIDAGLLTDELESNQTGASPGAVVNSSLPSGGLLDARILPELSSGDGTNADRDYNNLQSVRGGVNQALGALTAYDTAAPPAMHGELYALEGYAEILLADLFCSGVPLSTLDFQKDFTYHASSTTAQVYQDALAKLDSALALSSTDDTVQNLARVLKGRALLDLGQYAQAAQAVAAVPDGFQYRLVVQWASFSGGNLLNDQATASDREGGNGLPFVSSGDPRVALTPLTCPSDQTCPVPLTFPVKYSTTGYSPFIVADAIEARLIQAEAALQGGDATTWLTLLNALRTTGAIDSVHPDTIISTTGTGTVDTTVQPDTAWHPGTGAAELGIPGLRPLTDPGTLDARVSLTFQERAYWLFLTGHRQGDLRRLIRQYGRTQDHVYPTGRYFAPGTSVYGGDVTAPIPSTEFVNPLFHGCLSRGA